MQNTFESRSRRVHDYGDRVASSFRRPSDEDEEGVKPSKVLYIITILFFLMIVSPPLLGRWA